MTAWLTVVGVSFVSFCQSLASVAVALNAFLSVIVGVVVFVVPGPSLPSWQVETLALASCCRQL